MVKGGHDPIFAAVKITGAENDAPVKIGYTIESSSGTFPQQVWGELKLSGTREAYLSSEGELLLEGVSHACWGFFVLSLNPITPKAWTNLL